MNRVTYNLERFIIRTNEASTPEQVTSEYTTAMENFGLDRIYYNIYTENYSAVFFNNSELMSEPLHKLIEIPIYGQQGKVADIRLSSSYDDKINELSKNVASLVKAYSLHFHSAYTEKKFEKDLPDNKAHKIVLTKRERQILSWAARGKSDSVIADITGISYSTVRYHLNNIYKKLDVNEKTLAVVKAISYGLL